METTQEFPDPFEDQITLGKLLALIGEPAGEAPSLDQLVKEARGFGKRRADRQGSRDNLIYRGGYGLDAVGALSIEPEVWAGMLSSSILMIQSAVFASQVSKNDAFIPNLIVLLERNPELVAWARQVGRSLCWDRLNALYIKETEIFKQSAAFADPHARWRSKAATAGQRYLIGEICRLTGLDATSITKRGPAFDFIDEHGGNPRFWRRPSISERPEIVQ